MDFEPVAKELSFSNGECTHTVPVAILDCKSFDKSAAFHVHFEILKCARRARRWQPPRRPPTHMRGAPPVLPPWQLPSV
ncbi:MAG: hypothetical protein ACK4ZJ_17660, partial [Allorhizobium sp.]